MKQIKFRVLAAMTWAVMTAVGLSAQNEPKQIKLSKEEQEMVKGSNLFAFKLFGQAQKNSDLILSPLSVTYALGLLNNGAAGETQEQINKVLGFGDTGADGINTFCSKLLTEAPGLDELTKVLISNTIFVNQGMGYELKASFTEKAKTYYQAEPDCRDFGDGKTLDVINQWANDHTEGMIPQILSEDEFDPTFVSYLLNAIYFKGTWTLKFDEKDTQEEAFETGSKQPPVVPMMHMEKELPYLEDDDFQAVRLPYGDGAYAMTVLLPREGKDGIRLLKAMTANKWNDRYQYPYYYKDAIIVDLKLPRFETDTNIDLQELMCNLGMPKAFNPAAEFPDFCNTAIYIGLMKQVAKIKVNEEGTEAAAVTIIGEKTAGVHEPKQVKFHANRPFMYVISEQSTGAIFFIGQYTGQKQDSKGTNALEKPTVAPSDDNGVIYNLSGQRLTAPPAKGLYIQNGKKMVAI